MTDFVWLGTAKFALQTGSDSDGYEKRGKTGDQRLRALASVFRHPSPAVNNTHKFPQLPPCPVSECPIVRSTVEQGIP